jgi:hypothetical protein
MNKPILGKLSSKIDAGIKFAISTATEKHCRLGESISTWHSEKIVTLTADQIPPTTVLPRRQRQLRR